MIFAIFLLSSGAGLAGGLFVGGRSKRTKILLSAVALVAIIAFALLRHSPRLESMLVRSDAFFAVHTFWAIPIFLFLVGIGIRRMRSVILRDTALIAAGISLWWQAEATFQYAFMDRSQLRGETDQSGFCRQTTGYSCAPAAAATLLHQFGVASTEREMGDLARTTRDGTFLTGICRALNVKLRPAGMTAIADRFTWDELCAVRKPCLVNVFLWRQIHHTVVLLEVTDKGVVLLDPLVGRETRSWKNFLDEYDGEAVIVEGIH